MSLYSGEQYCLEENQYARSSNEPESYDQGSRHFEMVPLTSGTRGAAHAQRGALSNILSPVLAPHMW